LNQSTYTVCLYRSQKNNWRRSASRWFQRLLHHLDWVRFEFHLCMNCIEYRSENIKNKDRYVYIDRMRVNLALRYLALYFRVFNSKNTIYLFNEQSILTTNYPRSIFNISRIIIEKILKRTILYYSLALFLYILVFPISISIKSYELILQFLLWE
jgi:hypothetical protein